LGSSLAKCKTCGAEFRQYRSTDRYCSFSCVPKKRKNVTTKPIARRSKKLAKKEREYSEIRKLFLDENPKCSVCQGVATEIHHKKGRGKYLLIVKYFLAVCWRCHKEIEENPIWAKENNYSVSRLSNFFSSKKDD
jgi:hypothetical protein